MENPGHDSLSLVVVMDKFSTLAFPNCLNFVFGSKHFVCSEMGMIDSIMTLKYHVFAIDIEREFSSDRNLTYGIEFQICPW